MHIIIELTWARGLSLSASAGALLAMAAAGTLMAAARLIDKYYLKKEDGIEHADTGYYTSDTSVKRSDIIAAMPALRPDEGIQSSNGILSSSGALGLHKNSGQFIIKDDYMPKK